MLKDNARAPRRARYWPDTLAGRLAGTLAVVVLLATTVMLGIEYLRGRQTLLREATQRLAARDRLVADRLERALTDRLRLVAVWPGLGAAQDLAVDDVDKRLAASLAELASTFDGRDLAVAVNPAGRVVAASDPAWIGRGIADRGWFRILQSTTTPSARLHLLGEPADSAVLAVSPVFGPGDQQLGWVSLLTPWSQLLEEVAPDDRAGLALRDAAGHLVAGIAPAQRADLVVREQTRDVGGLRFSAELSAPVSEALRPLRDTGRQLSTLALVFLAVTLPGTVLLARSTTGELRRLTHTAGQARLGARPDFDRTSTAAPREVRVLSDALETMVVRLEESRHELARQESLAAMGMMAAALAHEIRTPLSIMGGAAEMLGRQAAEDTREEELTSFILAEVSRLGRLVDDLLAFARPRAPKQVPLDLADVGRQAVAALAEEFRTADVALETDLAPAPVAGDADQLYQVALNLLVNARKASPPGRTVRVTTLVEEGSALLEIRDEGKGIPPERWAEVWKPFFTTGAGGTGLGLPIVKRIVEAHGGEATLRSEPGRGTSATVRLPYRSLA